MCNIKQEYLNIVKLLEMRRVANDLHDEKNRKINFRKNDFFKNRKVIVFSSVFIFLLLSSFYFGLDMFNNKDNSVFFIVSIFMLFIFNIKYQNLLNNKKTSYVKGYFKHNKSFNFDIQNTTAEKIEKSNNNEEISQILNSMNNEIDIIVENFKIKLEKSENKELLNKFNEILIINNVRDVFFQKEKDEISKKMNKITDFIKDVILINPKNEYSKIVKSSLLESQLKYVKSFKVCSSLMLISTLLYISTDYKLFATLLLFSGIISGLSLWSLMNQRDAFYISNYRNRVFSVEDMEQYKKDYMIVWQETLEPKNIREVNQKEVFDFYYCALEELISYKYFKE